MATDLAETGAQSVARQFGVEVEFQRVLDHTRQLFGVQPHVEVVEDPEIPAQVHFVFCVTAAGTVESALQLSASWHNNIVSLTGKALHLFYLSIDID